MTHRIATLTCALLVSLALGCASEATPPSSDSDALASARGRSAISGASCPNPDQISVAEECNAFDDDCDGVMDEGVCDDPCNVFDAPVRRGRQ